MAVPGNPKEQGKEKFPEKRVLANNPLDSNYINLESVLKIMKTLNLLTAI